MAEQKHTTPNKDEETTHEEEEVPTESATDTDVDDLLEEIDDVLEENSEEFVKSYVQRGGE